MHKEGKTKHQPNNPFHLHITNHWNSEPMTNCEVDRVEHAVEKVETRDEYMEDQAYEPTMVHWAQRHHM